MKNLVATILLLSALILNGLHAQVNAGKINFPVNLSTEDDNTVLHWTTEKEVNTSYFLIETSNDNTNFTTIGKVRAAGYSLTNNQYELSTNSQNVIRTFVRVSLVSMDGERETTLMAITNYNTKDSLLSSK